MKKRILPLLVVSIQFLTFLVLFQNFNTASHIRIVDSSNGDNAGEKFTYAYAPYLIRENSSNTIHAFYCSTGNPSLNYDNWDVVRYSVSHNGGLTWSVPKALVRASNYVQERAACDPSVIYYENAEGKYYYMYYSGNEKNVQTVVFLARASKIDGPYYKLTNRGTWEQNPNDPKVMIRPRKPIAENAGYGAGQTTLVVKDGKIHIWHNDTSVSNRDFVYYQTTTDPKKVTQGVATNVTTNDLSAGSVDVKYDPIQKRFVMYGIRMGHYKQAMIVARYSTDGITWTGQNVICDQNCTPDFINNIGALGTHQGYLLPGNFLAYGAPYDLRNDCSTESSGVDKLCWAHWDVFGKFYSNISVPGGEIVGTIDGIRNVASGYEITGWACSVGAPVSIPIHIYAKNATSQTFVMAATANVASSDGIASHCKHELKKNRFKAVIPYSAMNAHFGKQINIYGLSPYGIGNSALNNSGKFSLPSGNIKGYLDNVTLSGGNVVLRGWTCAEGMNNSLAVHFYVENSNGTKTYIGSGQANANSEAAVSTACQSIGTKHRFLVSFSQASLKAHKGKKIIAYGISPIGQANRTLTKSGTFKVP